MTGIIIVDKPEAWTSHDVVAKLRGLLGERRIGHGGTLDPMATGVLPVFVGRATRAVSLMPSGKAYQAVLRLGLTTDSQDITGNVITTCDAIPSLQQVVEVAGGFLGEVLQTPPMVSAVKVDGRRLYQYARQGVEIERAPRRVTFNGIDVAQLSSRDYRLDVRCSGGTYIRTLCHDIGAMLGCGAALAALRRTRSGPFTLDNAVTLDDIASSQNRSSLLMPVDSLFSDRPALYAQPSQRTRILNGSSYTCGNIEDGEYRVYSQDGKFLMLGKALGGSMTAIKSFFEV